MVPAFDNLNLIDKLSSADLFVINEQRCWSVGYSPFHFLHDMQILHVRLSASVVSFWKNIEVHPEFDSLSMKDASIP